MAIRSYTERGQANVGAFVEIDVKRRLVQLAYQRHESLSQVIRGALTEKIDRELIAASTERQASNGVA